MPRQKGDDGDVQVKPLDGLGAVPLFGVFPRRYKCKGQYWSSRGRYEPCEWITIVWAECGDWLMVSGEGSGKEVTIIHRSSLHGEELPTPNVRTEPAASEASTH